LSISPNSLALSSESLQLPSRSTDAHFSTSKWYSTGANYNNHRLLWWQRWRQYGGTGVPSVPSPGPGLSHRNGGFGFAKCCAIRLWSAMASSVIHRLPFFAFFFVFSVINLPFQNLSCLLSSFSFPFFFIFMGVLVFQAIASHLFKFEFYYISSFFLVILFL
jgi:hypothetical protein